MHCYQQSPASKLNENSILEAKVNINAKINKSTKNKVCADVKCSSNDFLNTLLCFTYSVFCFTFPQDSPKVLIYCWVDKLKAKRNASQTRYLERSFALTTMLATHQLPLLQMLLIFCMISDILFCSIGLYHWIWINSGGCNVDSTFFTSLGSSLKSVRSSCSSLNSLKFRTKQPWRRKILDALKQRNESVIERYKTFDGANQQEV